MGVAGGVVGVVNNTATLSRNPRNLFSGKSMSLELQVGRQPRILLPLKEEELSIITIGARLYGTR